MPFTDARHCVSDNLDELDDRVRDIAGLIVHITSAAAFADREETGQAGANDGTRGRVTALTRAVGTLGRALADLSAAVAHAGDLQRLDGLLRSAEGARDQQVTRSALDNRLNGARRHLYEAGRQLLVEAEHITPAHAESHGPKAPSSAPLAPRPAKPAPIRTR
ncbi:hypothetical protein [Streptomyces sp. H39-C1]|uniref:hypothetical protein n=1 Tax=Streptomyces sp. H39-C1 TaxID=3004355 RepID=UPI0022AEE96D|nr:hypothetical protein [Streptomyces sp. H39-C1]MCZ4103453.1 hypothetical protein [Streptomyces sp. H39-C1]